MGLDVGGDARAGKLSSAARSKSLRNSVGTAVFSEGRAHGVLANEGFREDPGEAATVTSNPGITILESSLLKWNLWDFTTMMAFENGGGRGLMRIGYARVPADEHSLDLQFDGLKAGGCQRIVTEKVSSTKADHPGLEEAISYLRRSNVLLAWKQDRLGRTVKRRGDYVADLQVRKIRLRSLTDRIDNTTPSGRFLSHVMASPAQMSGSCRPSVRVKGWSRRGGRAGLEAGNGGGRRGRWNRPRSS